MKIVTIDMSDPETQKKHLRISALVLALLVSECDSPVEAYAILHHCTELLGKEYEIAGAQDLVMPTDKIQ